jgi:probable F420-dependent oxidoreductase
VQYSIALPYPELGEEFCEPDALVAIAQAAEASGLEAVWLTDHPFPLVGPGLPGHRALDQFAAGGFIAATTTRLRIHLNIVVMAYRNPFVLAQSLATLDRLSNGRVIAGIGAGYMEAEFAALGADWERRHELVEEGLAAMKAAWTGEPVFREGAGWRVDGNRMAPRPSRSPQPVLWRGGNSRSAMSSAVSHCDGWSPFEATASRAQVTGTAQIDGLDRLADRIALLRELEQTAGRSRPLDVCLVRGYHSYTAGRLGENWLDEAEAVHEEIERFEAIGIDWLALALPGRSVSEVIENIARFAALRA